MAKTITITVQLFDATLQGRRSLRLSGSTCRLGIVPRDMMKDTLSNPKLNEMMLDKYSFFIKVQLGNLASGSNDENSSKKKYDIKGGTYVLNTSMNYDEILSMICDAKNSIEGEVTVEDAEASP